MERERERDRENDMKTKRKTPDYKQQSASYYKLATKIIDDNRKLRDQFIGTLMLLAYDGCISEGRACELAGIDVYQWREELRRILKWPVAVRKGNK